MNIIYGAFGLGTDIQFLVRPTPSARRAHHVNAMNWKSFFLNNLKTIFLERRNLYYGRVELQIRHTWVVAKV